MALISTQINKTGIGIDIGTTTVQAQLVNISDGEELQSFSVMNKQCIYGADVMSRIDAARNGKARELFNIINSQVEEILRQCIDSRSLPCIDKCNVSGNTAMLHLFAGANPGAMGEAPYTPVFLEERHFTGKELSLSANHVTLLPGVSAFFGADIMAGLACIDILNKNENALFVDIGTNGEIALWNSSKKRLYCCSTAAGPCFEGAEISCGMTAESGAINKISFKKESAFYDRTQSGPLFYTTLGNVKARGICGAGLIDAIFAMKKIGVIDETGALADEFAQTGFPITEGIVIAQRDVRQFQLAKAAIFSGIQVLCRTAGLEPEELAAAYIAGGLGFFINLENAAGIGLIPSQLVKNAVVCGNTSLKGAVKSLTDPSFLPRCREIASNCTVIDLALDNVFYETFAENMCL